MSDFENDFKSEEELAAEQLKHESEREELRRAYRHVFGSPDGRLVLADLMREYGFEESGLERCAVSAGLRSEELWLREGAKEPVRRMLWMTGARLLTVNEFLTGSKS